MRRIIDCYYIKLYQNFFYSFQTTPPVQVPTTLPTLNSGLTQGGSDELSGVSIHSYVQS